MTRRSTSRNQLSVETLEPRQLMTSVPFGASANDTGEFMLGDVLVSVVLVESDGSIDAQSENWTGQQINKVKQTIREGLDWWSDLLDQQDTVHELEFKLDFFFSMDNCCPQVLRYPHCVISF